jgi:hypothetical protein
MDPALQEVPKHLNKICTSQHQLAASQEKQLEEPESTGQEEFKKEISDIKYAQDRKSVV